MVNFGAEMPERKFLPGEFPICFDCFTQLFRFCLPLSFLLTF